MNKMLNNMNKIEMESGVVVFVPDNVDVQVAAKPKGADALEVACTGNRMNALDFASNVVVGEIESIPVGVVRKSFAMKMIKHLSEAVGMKAVFASSAEVKL